MTTTEKYTISAAAVSSDFLIFVALDSANDVDGVRRRRWVT